MEQQTCQDAATTTKRKGVAEKMVRYSYESRAYSGVAKLANYHLLANTP